MTKKITKTNKKAKDFKKYLQEIESPDYPWVAKGCPENASSLEKAKYETCQSILDYKLTNHLTAQQIAKKVQLDKDETQKLLFCWIDNFTLDELVIYAERLFSPSQIQININPVVISKKPRKSILHA